MALVCDKKLMTVISSQGNRKLNYSLNLSTVGTLITGAKGRGALFTNMKGPLR